MAIGTALAITGLALAAGTSVASGIIGSKAAGKAADTQAQAAADVSQLAQDSAATAASGVDAATVAANEKLAGLPEEVKQILAPYLDLGNTGTEGLKKILGPGGDLDKQFAFNPDDLTKTPGYQFTLSQGMEAIKRSAAAQGKSLGGGTLKSLTKYGEGVASTTYGQEFQRALDTFNANQKGTALKLSGLLDTTRIGQSSATDVGNTVQASEVGQAGNLINDATYAGNTKLQAAAISGGAKESGAAAQAAGTIGSANAWSSALGSIGNDALSFLTYKNLIAPKVGAGAPPLQSYYSMYGTNAYDPLTPVKAMPAPPVTYAPGAP